LKRKREDDQEEEEQDEDENEREIKRSKLDTSFNSENGTSKKQNVPFQRVKRDGVVFRHDSLADDSYKQPATSFGVKAYQDLKVTKGKSFRQAKTKKKRGTYKGGELDTTTVRSVKF